MGNRVSFSYDEPGARSYSTKTILAGIGCVLGVLLALVAGFLEWHSILIISFGLISLASFYFAKRWEMQDRVKYGISQRSWEKWIGPG